LFAGLSKVMTLAHAAADSNNVNRALAKITPKSFGV
jgi:hypothetical protein